MCEFNLLNLAILFAVFFYKLNYARRPAVAKTVAVAFIAIFAVGFVEIDLFGVGQFVYAPRF